MRFLFLIIYCLLFLHKLEAQQDTTRKRVGVVLSGGGSWGFAHIGVLKALEEHHIPVDYITGTSAGALIGGMYASGYSPGEMTDIAMTKTFQWLDTKLLISDRTFFKKEKNFGTFIKIPISFRGKTSIIPENLVSDYGVNLGLTELSYGASAKANYDFDSLFVPFRAIAADVFDKRALTLKQGQVSFALRSSMSVPLFFLPVSNGTYRNLYDGGIYDNFPVKPMQEEFNPDFIIGVHVGGAPTTREDLENKNNAMSYLLHNSVDQIMWQKLPPNSTYIGPDLGGISITDFSDPAESIRRGYDATIPCIEEIKLMTGTVDSLERAKKRMEFRQNWPEFAIERIYIYNVPPSEEFYIRKVFSWSAKKNIVSFTEFEKAYNRLKNDGNFRGIFPELFFNPSTQKYNLHLHVTPERNFGVRFGGAFFNPTDHQLHLGAYFSKVYYLTAFSADIDLERGSFTNFINSRIRMDVPTKTPFYIELENMIQSFDLQRITPFGFSYRTRSNNSFNSVDFSIKTGIPLQTNGKITLGVSFIKNTYKYFQNDLIGVDDTLDNTFFNGQSGFFTVEKSTLNRKMYADEGSHIYLNVRLNNGNEDFISGKGLGEYGASHTWLQAAFLYQNYFKYKFFRMGFHVSAAYSGVSSFSNYRATLLTSPKFNPLADSKLLFLPGYYSKAYGAAGMQTIFALNKKIDIRLEGYWMQSLFQLKEELNKPPTQELTWKNKKVTLGAGLIYQTAIGPIGAFVHYYDQKPNAFRMFIHLGFLIFQRHPWE